MLVNSLNISAKEIRCRAQQCCLGFKIEPSQVVSTHIFLIRIRCYQTKHMPSQHRETDARDRYQGSISNQMLMRGRTKQVE